MYRTRTCFSRYFVYQMEKYIDMKMADPCRHERIEFC